MLYERWRTVAAARMDQPALLEAAGRTWSFADLAAGAGAVPAQALRFPQLPAHPAPGGLAAFVLEVLAAWRDDVPCCPLEPGQPRPAFPLPPRGFAHLKQTSATTGPARCIAFTQDQLAADADQIVDTMGLRPDWPNVGVISPAHSYGFSNLILPLLLHGIPLIESASALPDSVGRAAAKAAAVTIPAVPALWRAWHEAGTIPANLKLAISAGAPLPLSLEQAVFARTGLKLHNFYGSSECGGIAYDDTDTPRPDAACAGSPLRGVQVAINEAGCLDVRSRAVGLGYWPEPQPALGNGRFTTSDLAEILDGRIWLRGRAGDVINVAGRKVSPELIERTLLAHPDVREVLVFGSPSADAGRGEDVVACVVGPPGLEAAALRQFLGERLPAWQVPRRWHFVASLSPNARGKLSRAEWRQRLEPASPQERGLQAASTLPTPHPPDPSNARLPPAP